MQLKILKYTDKYKCNTEYFIQYKSLGPNKQPQNGARFRLAMGLDTAFFVLTSTYKYRKI